MAHYTRIGTVALRQIPFDFNGNVKRIMQAYEQALSANVNLLLFPELALTGYGCEDNFTFQEFNDAAEAALARVIQGIQQSCNQDSANNMIMALGMPIMFPGGQVFNAIAVISQQGLHGFSCKQFLARNGLHYEPRWFEAWPRKKVMNHPKFNVPMGDIVIDAMGIRIGFETCEDSWISNRPGRDLYQRNVDVILNPSASHFAVGKNAIRKQFVREGSRAFGVAYAYANLNGTENGTSIFDAGCMIASEGDIKSFGERFHVAEVLINHVLVNISANRVSRINSSESIANIDENIISLPINICLQSQGFSKQNKAVYDKSSNSTLADFWASMDKDDLDYAEICYAIGNGLWDWMLRTKTKGYMVSLSGGADSGLVACLVYFSQLIAIHQLGITRYKSIIDAALEVTIDDSRHNDPVALVQNEVMPHLLWTLYQGTDNSSDTTFNAAQGIAKEIGARFEQWNIQPLVSAYNDLVNSLTPEDPLGWEKDDIALQNIQARARSPGVWMLANRSNKLLIATSNLSESALGYATMDGDTSGVMSAISGISKSRIRKLNLWLENQGLPIASSKFEKTQIKLPSLKLINQQQPTAELRPEAQTDEEDLMPYDICDFIMDCYLIKQMWPKSILVELLIEGYGDRYAFSELASFIQRWFTFFCRNPWKRYGIRAGFHIEQISLDPKTFHRFPLLNSGFSEQLREMWDYVDEQKDTKDTKG
ncbi:NAD(+) synthase [Glaciecola sp. 1036]|uniref:NAD(+) synthase n=1 Tax=Alteromonadaceae TaxID=72275 RepID=UPI003D08C1CC